ncbi:MAG: hypothetical protein ACK4N5_06375 [Myxococcales bacterium]
MSYSDFGLPDVIQKFSLVTREVPGLFGNHPPVQPSPALLDVLGVQIPLGVAIGNEKARSELIVAPVLAELKRLKPTAIGFFSGVDLPADPAAGLTGTCDFLLSLTPEQYFVRAPVVTVVEAKRGDLSSGMGQCVAAMVGARVFNERAGNAIETVYGAVTTGTEWRFMGLGGAVLSIDMDDYSVKRLDQLLGILSFMVTPQPSA